MEKNKVLVLYPPSHKHLGLFTDLEYRKDVILRCSELKPTQNSLIRFFQYIADGRNINKYFHIPYRYKWYTHSDIFQLANILNSVIIIDGALNNLQISELKKLKKEHKKIKFYLYFINSIGASSPLMIGVREKYTKFAWDDIWTFDPEEAKKYGFTYRGFDYYSKHDIKNAYKQQCDVYYVGGNKGGRMNLVVEIFDAMKTHGVNANFDICQSNKQYDKYEGLNYIEKWIPYQDVLDKVNGSKCILEVLQNGQYGASLRYFEAVCYNKKLLTTNPYIHIFPYYNAQWMRVLKTIDDIDWDWLTNDEIVDYGYRGDFSPNKLINYVNNKES